MGAFAEFIFTLPIKVVAGAVVLIFFVVFGLLKHSTLMPCKYDDWYDMNRRKLTKILRWE